MYEEERADPDPVRRAAIEAIREIDCRLGRIFSRYDTEIASSLTKEEAVKCNRLEAERRRLVNYLVDHGGLPPGMNDVY